MKEERKKMFLHSNPANTNSQTHVIQLSKHTNISQEPSIVNFF